METAGTAELALPFGQAEPPPPPGPQLMVRWPLEAVERLTEQAGCDLTFLLLLVGAK